MQHNPLRILAIIAVMAIHLSGSFGFSAHARVVRGVVMDSLTHEKMRYVNVTMPRSNSAALTHDDGRFSLRSKVAGDELRFTALGYATKIIPVDSVAADSVLQVYLAPVAKQLDEVVIRPKKQKYSKKNNPAVELMEKIRASRDLNDPRREDYYNYDKYEKIVVALNEAEFALPDTTKKKKPGKFDFVRDYVDTSTFTGKPILNLSVRERRSRQLYRRNPESRKQVTTGLRSEGVDQAFNQENFQRILEDIFREVDIYGNDVTLMQNRFVSPLSRIGADYYMYFITDTVAMGPEKFVELSFAPHNPESMGFNGKLYVAVGDTTCFIRRVKMQVPKSINLNYVKNLFVEQSFERDTKGNRHKVRDDMAIELCIIPGMPELYARRTTLASNQDYEKDEIFAQFYDLEGPAYTLTDADKRDEAFWDENRMTALTSKEAGLGTFTERLRSVKLYRVVELVVNKLVTGYIATGKKSKFDFGPLNTLVSFNSAEGARFRIGGITTANLSPHIFARGYLAYGTKDRKFKYRGELEYSFVAKRYHSREFPMHSLRAEYQYDIDMLGQHYLFTNPDNIFLSLKRKKSNLVTYRRLMQLSYILERRSGWAFDVSVRQERQEASPYIQFVDGYGVNHRHFNQAAIKVGVRFAPGETFVQMQSIRMPINLDNWVVQLTHEYGPKGMFGADFTLNKTELSVQKRFWFSAFGYTDMILKAAKIWSTVQFPALTWQNANLSYTIQPESFALLNPMEFATDQYASWDLTYWGNGILFNRIPWIKKAKLREVVSFRGFTGSLTNKNNPELNPELFRFPSDTQVYPMQWKPYMEIGVGIDNIFTILRVDYVWRLTYRDHPNTDRSGLRISLHFAF